MVHGDGVLDDIPIKAMGRSAASGAFYRSLTGKALKIEVKKSSPAPEMTFAHELGHYLDYQAIGLKGQFETEFLNGNTKKLIEKLNDSSRIKSIRTALIDGVIKKGKDETPLSIGMANHLKYLLEPKEMFARAYAQFIAVKSGNKRMMNQLKSRQKKDSDMNIGYQWEDEDFKEILKAFEELFIYKGWLSR